MLVPSGLNIAAAAPNFQRAAIVTTPFSRPAPAVCPIASLVDGCPGAMPTNAEKPYGRGKETEPNICRLRTSLTKAQISGMQNRHIRGPDRVDAEATGPTKPEVAHPLGTMESEANAIGKYATERQRYLGNSSNQSVRYTKSAIARSATVHRAGSAGCLVPTARDKEAGRLGLLPGVASRRVAERPRAE